MLGQLGLEGELRREHAEGQAVGSHRDMAGDMHRRHLWEVA